jgi:hypothetical protein
VNADSKDGSTLIAPKTLDYWDIHERKDLVNVCTHKTFAGSSVASSPISIESDAPKFSAIERKKPAASCRKKLPGPDQRRNLREVKCATYARPQRHNTFRPRLILRHFQPVESVIVCTMKTVTSHMLECRNLFQRSFQLLQRKVQSIIVDIFA